MRISVAQGDGIGPEIMGSVLQIFDKVQVPLEYEHVRMGKEVVLAGDTTGVSAPARRSVESTGILFKGPMETPRGEGYECVNVTARKLWGAFASKRVFRTFSRVPTPTGLRALDLTLIKDNIEDMYGALEHMQTHDVAQSRRFITRPGSEQVHRYTFEVATRKGARRVTCAHKANIMKMTDGLFLEAFYDVAKDYPDIEADDIIVDTLAMRLVQDPSEFEVIVLPNLHAGIITDLTAGLVGGLAYAPSANIGDSICIFEAVQGALPDVAGNDLANPTALLLSGTMMLRHLGLVAHAAAIENALESTLRAMHRRPDLGEPIPVFQTSVFTEKMLDALHEVQIPEGQIPRLEVHRPTEPSMRVTPEPGQTILRGVDVFLESGLPPKRVEEQLAALGGWLKLTMISNRGSQVSPLGSAYTDCVNHYRARFETERPVSQHEIVSQLSAVGECFRLCGAEWLREIDGAQGYSTARV
ncbi:MAG: isocitrate/isopropylmalate family dehydrogenase [Polyangiales bacterium]|jgi:isocitrate dehydrogenase